MAIKAKINTSNVTKGSVKTTNKIQATTIALGQLGNKLTELADVDASDLDDGAMIVYDLASETFLITNRVQNPETRIIGGAY